MKPIEQMKNDIVSNKKTKEMKKNKIEKKEKQPKDRSNTIILFITGLLFVGMAFLFNNGFFATENGQLDTSILIGTVIVAFGIEILVYKKIGRLHAEIYQKDGYFFLMDMNSSNGTYLNNNTERLIACTDYKLNSGDSIRFANEEYIFKAGH